MSPVASRTISSNATSKLMRKWGDSPVTERDMAELDYSSSVSPGNAVITDHVIPVDVGALVSNDAMGTRGADGAYEVADWDFGRSKGEDLPTEEEILARGINRMEIRDDGETDVERKEQTSASWGSMLARLTGKKVLQQDDLRPVLVEMEKHLMSKNVAKDISEKLCDAVGAALIGKKLGGLTSKSMSEKESCTDCLYRCQIRSTDRSFRNFNSCPHSQNFE